MLEQIKTFSHNKSLLYIISVCIFLLITCVLGVYNTLQGRPMTIEDRSVSLNSNIETEEVGNLYKYKYYD